MSVVSSGEPRPQKRPRARPRAMIAVVAALLVLGGAGAPAEAETEGGGPRADVSYHSFFEGWGAEHYALDPIPRFLEPHQRLRCETDGIVAYRSRDLRYAVRVHPAFVGRLERFEAFVTELAREHYGRAPRRLVHRGAFACRSARARRGRISEHAFGNALDLLGFDFPALRRGEAAPANMPAHVRGAFQLRVLSHWSPRRSRDDWHALFLHRMAEGLRRRPDIFRGIVGPPRPRHQNHLHLDAAPWRYAMFAYDRVGGEQD